MTPPNLMECLPEIASRIDRGGPILLGLDFDGTLAPIMSRPDEVVLDESIRALIARMAGSKRTRVMIVSGRGLRDVASKVGIPGLIYAGNHGLEIEGPNLAFIEPTADATARHLLDLTNGLRTRFADVPGALVEPKGLSASVHYRNVAPDLVDKMARVVRDAVATDLDRFVLTSGHKVWEIRPRVTWNKGDALAWAIDRLGADASRLVFYLGDDRTDEDAFIRLPDGITVKVGSPATPTSARYALSDPAAVHSFLRWLEGRLTA